MSRSRNNAFHLSEPQISIVQMQFGVISYDQLRDSGSSKAEIRTLLDRQALVRVHRGVYTHTVVEPTFEQRAFATFLSVGEPMAFCGYTAAQLWGFKVDSSQVLELLIPHERRIRRLLLDVTRVSPFPGEFITTKFGMSITNASLTIACVAEHRGLNWAETAIDQALRQRLTTVKELRECQEYLARTCRRREKLVRELLVTRDDDTALAESVLESKILQWILRANLPKPTPQYEIFVNGSRRRLDFAYPELKIAIEVDGFAFHNDRGVFDRDRILSTWLASSGWLVLRVTSRTTRDELIAVVTSSIQQRREWTLLE